MNIIVVGVNYKSTPLEIRERLSFNIEEQKTALNKIVKVPSVGECVILSTCNRTEVYIYSDNPHFDSSLIENLLCEIKGLELYELKKYFYIYASAKAVKHLFKVACGLDSMVLGEDQILGQVKDAYELSLELGTSSSTLNKLFREAITVAKKVKTFTELSKNSISIGSLAVKLITNIFGDKLNAKCALVIGTGKIGSIALKNLLDLRLGKIYVTNRTHGRAQDISKEYGNIEIVDYNLRYSVVEECDIVISSTSSPHYTITRDQLEKTLDTNKARVFIDLAVPRDLDMAIKDIFGIECFNIDDLQISVDRSIDKRLLETSKAEEIIDEYLVEYEKWYEFRGVLPIIKDIQRFTDCILNERVNQTLSKLKDLSDDEKEVVKASLTATANEILNKFIYRVRENGKKEDVEVYFRCLKEVIKEVDS